MLKLIPIKIVCVSILISGTLIVLFSCSLEKGRSVEKIQKSGKLIILTRNAPTTYYFDSNDQSIGFEYEMAESFAKYLGVQTEYKVFHTILEILEALSRGEGDLAAAGIFKTKARGTRFRFGPTYQQVKQQVICRNGLSYVREAEDLIGLKLVVQKNSSYEKSLSQLKKQFPNLSWESSDTLNSEQLLEKVSQSEIDCTTVDSNIASINRRYFPQLIVAFNLSKADLLAWVLHSDSGDLQTALEKWFEKFESSGEKKLNEDRYY